MLSSDENIVVIGAGVVGLSTAILLQSSCPGTRITIMAAELPSSSHHSADYASMWAGAHYRPIPGPTVQLQTEAKLAFKTAEVMRDISRRFPEAGVEILLGVEHMENPTESVMQLKSGDVYAGPNDEFRVLREAELPHAVRWGCEYVSYCVNVEIYCKWLLCCFINKGGKIIQKVLSSAKDAFTYAQCCGLGRIDKVVNCSGRNFDQDPCTKIIRGQTVLVRQQYHKTITRQRRDGTWTVLIPRPRGGGTIVAGTKELGDMETSARPETRHQLLSDCCAAFPDFVDSVEKFEVIKDIVGRRPWRKGGLRIEAERTEAGGVIVHAYGAGGRGYEVSWGIADEVLGLTKAHAKTRPML